ncbi:hypothetical protein QPK87_09285 [Kamptonema cortianum]|nr:hypothetical protein [Kamptonema cortianum]MDL5046159.1 hypothetical protein [Oscillatoria amoena NRMC-F 0135]
MEEWNIQSRAHACAATGQKFEEGEQIVSMLFPVKDGYERRDYCQQAWREIVTTPQSAPASYWQTKYFTPAPPPPEALKKDDAEGLLRKLIDENDPATINTRYILAVMLERKRIFRQIDTFTNDQMAKMIVYEHLKSGESFTIADPNLRLDQIMDVQKEVIAMLGGKPPQSVSGSASQVEQS